MLITIIMKKISLLLLIFIIIWLYQKNYLDNITEYNNLNLNNFKNKVLSTKENISISKNNWKDDIKDLEKDLLF